MQNDDRWYDYYPRPGSPEEEAPRVYTAEVVDSREEIPPPPAYRHHRVRLPVILFLLTCASTFWAGYAYATPPNLADGLIYAAALMTILLCHELGHFLQARRYGVYASLPYFIPMPITPIGTMGAVIGMEARVGDRKALFDIGITGPLAGLVPTLLFCVIGLYRSEFEQLTRDAYENPPIFIQVPLLMRWITDWIVGQPPPDYVLNLHPLAFAGWVGLLITSLNLFPIGQLDGGHILYGLLRKRAHGLAWFLLLAAAVAVLVAGLVYGHPTVLGWLIMLSILVAMNPRHPPTANDYAPLGRFRIALGWLTLAFVPIGFTPIPFVEKLVLPPQREQDTYAALLETQDFQASLATAHRPPISEPAEEHRASESHRPAFSVKARLPIRSVGQQASSLHEQGIGPGSLDSRPPSASQFISADDRGRKSHHYRCRILTRRPSTRTRPSAMS